MSEQPAITQPSGRSRAIDRLRGSTPGRWPHIAAAEAKSREKMDQLSELANDLIPTDEGALVVFGSLARGEFTEKSDLDWALLIDGRAASGHLKIVQRLTQRLVDEKFIEPGSTGLFGGLVFSHDLIHAIGGDDDTNQNMTRRLLLLLESIAVDVGESSAVHNRIVLGVLERYVEEDAGFLASDAAKKIPRFLLNDVVRFWRTMAVDYANKYRAQAGKKWALRNIKLRMSRKLLFVSGLFMCISWKLSPPETVDRHLLAQRLVDHLRRWTQSSPLESLAVIIEKYAPSLVNGVFDSYDSFIELLNDRERREILQKLEPEESDRNPVFIAARQVSDKFDESLNRLLFDENPDIAKLAKKYGVF